MQAPLGHTTSLPPPLFYTIGDLWAAVTQMDLHRPMQNVIEKTETNSSNGMVTSKAGMSFVQQQK